MLKQLETSVLLLLVMTILTGGVYPAIVTAIAQTVFPHAANGSLIPQDPASAHPSDAKNRLDWRGSEGFSREETWAGSELIGQPFTRPKYFWGRLSATTPVPYNAASSSGSNLGPTNPDLLKKAQVRM